MRLKLPDNNPYSDKRIKHDITEMPNIESVYMDFKLHKYKYDQRLFDIDNEWHYGLIAQEVEETLNENGITINDTALVSLKDVDPSVGEDKILGENEQIYRINYSELHAMHIQMIQKQQERIYKLEERLSRLENLIEKL